MTGGRLVIPFCASCFPSQVIDGMGIRTDLGLMTKPADCRRWQAYAPRNVKNAGSGVQAIGHRYKATNGAERSLEKQ